MQVSEQTKNDVVEKGIRIYNERLKTILEPQHDKKYVVIHVDTGDYAINARRSRATLEMLSRHEPDGRLLAMRIGPTPESALATRLVGAHTATGNR